MPSSVESLPKDSISWEPDHECTREVCDWRTRSYKGDRAKTTEGQSVKPSDVDYFQEVLQGGT